MFGNMKIEWLLPCKKSDPSHPGTEQNFGKKDDSYIKPLFSSFQQLLCRV